MQFEYKLNKNTITNESFVSNIDIELNGVFSYKIQTILEDINNIMNFASTTDIKYLLFPLLNEKYVLPEDIIKQKYNINNFSKININDEIIADNICYIVGQEINNFDYIYNIDLLSYCYENVIICKPYTSAPQTFNIYIVCNKLINKSKFSQTKNTYLNSNYEEIYNFLLVYYLWIKYMCILSLNLIGEQTIENTIDFVNISPEKEYEKYIFKLMQYKK